MPAACDSVLEDIEDIVSAEDLKPHDRQFVRKNIFPKVRKRNSQKNIQTDDDPPSDSIIPGVQKIWIRTWGCSHNNSDGEYMAGQLAAYGYKITVFKKLLLACQDLDGWPVLLEFYGEKSQKDAVQ